MSPEARQKASIPDQEKAAAVSTTSQRAMEFRVRQRKAALIVKLDKKTGKKTPEHIVRIAEGKAS